MTPISAAWFHGVDAPGLPAVTPRALLHTVTGILFACSPCDVVPIVEGGDADTRGLVSQYVADFQHAARDKVCLSGIRLLPDEEEDEKFRGSGDFEVDGFYRSETKQIFLSDQIDSRNLKRKVWHELCHAWQRQVEEVRSDPLWLGTELDPVYDGVPPKKQADEAFALICEAGVEGVAILAAWAESCGDERLRSQVAFLQERVYVGADMEVSTAATGRSGAVQAPVGHTFRPTGFSLVGRTLFVWADGADVALSIPVELTAVDGQLSRGDGAVVEELQGWSLYDSAPTTTSSVTTWYRDTPGVGLTMAAAVHEEDRLRALTGVCGSDALHVLGEEELWIVEFGGDTLRWWPVRKP